MTDYLFPVELEPMADDEIASPDYEGDAEALKRVKISKDDPAYYEVTQLFNRVGTELNFCILAFWRDGNWSCFYKSQWPLPQDGKPLKGQRVGAYHGSKLKLNFYNMDTHQPYNSPFFGEVKHCA